MIKTNKIKKLLSTFILFYAFLLNAQHSFFSGNNNYVAPAVSFQAPELITNGLVLYLDAANPTSYSGTGTTWTDLSGNGNNGTLMNSPIYSATSGGNFVFNGSNTYVYAPITKAASCTFSAWAKSTNTSSNNMLFNAGNNGSGPDLFFSNGFIGLTYLINFLTE